MPTNTDTETLATKLAAMERDCLRCDGRGEWGDDFGNMVECETCDGSGKVPLFAGVRDKCPLRHAGDPRFNHSARLCICPGWTATLDLERWHNAVWAWKPSAEIAYYRTEVTISWWVDLSPIQYSGPTFLRALELATAEVA